MSAAQDPAAAPTRDELFTAYALTRAGAPYVRMNFVSSADGALTLNGLSGDLGGATDRRLMQVLRAMSDVILVGAGTVRTEGYAGVAPTPENAAWRAAHHFTPVPPLAIVSGSLALDPALPVFAEAAARPIVITHSAAPAGRRRALESVAEVIVCDPAGTGRVDLHEAHTQLAARSLNRVLCEGGPHLFGALLDADLVDELCLTLSPHLVGGNSGRIVQGTAESAHRLQLRHALTDADGFAFLRYELERGD